MNKDIILLIAQLKEAARLDNDETGINITADLIAIALTDIRRIAVALEALQGLKT